MDGNEYEIPFERSRRAKKTNPQEEKALGRSLGRRALGRAIGTPNIGRNRRNRRRDIDIPTGGIPGTRTPTGSDFDPDRDGWVDEGTTRPRFIGVGGTERKPKQQRSTARAQSGLSSGQLRLLDEDDERNNPQVAAIRALFEFPASPKVKPKKSNTVRALSQSEIRERWQASPMRFASAIGNDGKEKLYVIAAKSDATEIVVFDATVLATNISTIKSTNPAFAAMRIPVGALTGGPDARRIFGKTIVEGLARARVSTARFSVSRDGWKLDRLKTLKSFKNDSFFKKQILDTHSDIWPELSITDQSQGQNAPAARLRIRSIFQFMEDEDPLALAAHRSRNYKIGDRSALNGEPIRPSNRTWLRGMTSRQMAELLVPETADDLRNLQTEMFLRDLAMRTGVPYEFADKQVGSLVSREIELKSSVDGPDGKKIQRLDDSSDSRSKLVDAIEKALNENPALKWAMQTFGSPVISPVRNEYLDATSKHEKKDGFTAVTLGRHEYELGIAINSSRIDELKNKTPDGTASRPGPSHNDSFVQDTFDHLLSHEWGHWFLHQLSKDDAPYSIGKEGFVISSDHFDSRNDRDIAFRHAEMFKDRHKTYHSLAERAEKARQANLPINDRPSDTTNSEFFPRVLSTYGNSNMREMFSEGISAILSPDRDLETRAINDDLSTAIRRMLGIPKTSSDPYPWEAIARDEREFDARYGAIRRNESSDGLSSGAEREALRGTKEEHVARAEEAQRQLELAIQAEKDFNETGVWNGETLGIKFLANDRSFEKGIDFTNIGEEQPSTDLAELRKQITQLIKQLRGEVDLQRSLASRRERREKSNAIDVEDLTEEELEALRVEGEKVKLLADKLRSPAELQKLSEEEVAELKRQFRELLPIADGEILVAHAGAADLDGGVISPAKTVGTSIRGASNAFGDTVQLNRTQAPRVDETLKQLIAEQPVAKSFIDKLRTGKPFKIESQEELDLFGRSSFSYGFSQVRTNPDGSLEIESVSRLRIGDTIDPQRLVPSTTAEQIKTRYSFDRSTRTITDSLVDVENIGEILVSTKLDKGGTSLESHLADINEGIAVLTDVSNALRENNGQFVSTTLLTGYVMPSINATYLGRHEVSRTLPENIGRVEPNIERWTQRIDESSVTDKPALERFLSSLRGTMWFAFGDKTQIASIKEAEQARGVKIIPGGRDYEIDIFRPITPFIGFSLPIEASSSARGGESRIFSESLPAKYRDAMGHERDHLMLGLLSRALRARRDGKPLDRDSLLGRTGLSSGAEGDDIAGSERRVRIEAIQRESYAIRDQINQGLLLQKTPSSDPPYTHSLMERAFDAQPSSRMGVSLSALSFLGGIEQSFSVTPETVKLEQDINGLGKRIFDAMVESAIAKGAFSRREFDDVMATEKKRISAKKNFNKTVSSLFTAELPTISQSGLVDIETLMRDGVDITLPNGAVVTIRPDTTAQWFQDAIADPSYDWNSLDPNHWMIDDQAYHFLFSLAQFRNGLASVPNMTFEDLAKAASDRAMQTGDGSLVDRLIEIDDVHASAVFALELLFNDPRFKHTLKPIKEAVEDVADLSDIDTPAGSAHAKKREKIHKGLVSSMPDVYGEDVFATDDEIQEFLEDEGLLDNPASDSSGDDDIDDAIDQLRITAIKQLAKSIPKEILFDMLTKFEIHNRRDEFGASIGAFSPMVMMSAPNVIDFYRAELRLDMGHALVVMKRASNGSVIIPTSDDLDTYSDRLKREMLYGLLSVEELAILRIISRGTIHALLGHEMTHGIEAHDPLLNTMSYATRARRIGSEKPVINIKISPNGDITRHPIFTLEYDSFGNPIARSQFTSIEYVDDFAEPYQGFYYPGMRFDPFFNSFVESMGSWSQGSETFTMAFDTLIDPSKRQGYGEVGDLDIDALSTLLGVMAVNSAQDRPLRSMQSGAGLSSGAAFGSNDGRMSMPEFWDLTDRQFRTQSNLGIDEYDLANSIRFNNSDESSRSMLDQFFPLLAQPLKADSSFYMPLLNGRDDDRFENGNRFTRPVFTSAMLDRETAMGISVTSDGKDNATLLKLNAPESTMVMTGSGGGISSRFGENEIIFDRNTQFEVMSVRDRQSVSRRTGKTRKWREVEMRVVGKNDERGLSSGREDDKSTVKFGDRELPRRIEIEDDWFVDDTQRAIARRNFPDMHMRWDERRKIYVPSTGRPGLRDSIDEMNDEQDAGFYLWKKYWHPSIIDADSDEGSVLRAWRSDFSMSRAMTRALGGVAPPNGVRLVSARFDDDVEVMRSMLDNAPELQFTTWRSGRLTSDIGSSLDVGSELNFTAAAIARSSSDALLYDTDELSVMGPKIPEKVLFKFPDNARGLLFDEDGERRSGRQSARSVAGTYTGPVEGVVTGQFRVIDRSTQQFPDPLSPRRRMIEREVVTLERIDAPLSGRDRKASSESARGFASGGEGLASGAVGEYPIETVVVDESGEAKQPRFSPKLQGYSIPEEKRDPRYLVDDPALLEPSDTDFLTEEQKQSIRQDDLRKISRRRIVSAPVYSIGDEKIIFGDPDHYALPDQEIENGSIKIVRRRIDDLTGMERGSEEAYNASLEYADALYGLWSLNLKKNPGYEPTPTGIDSSYVDALLYAASRGDLEARSEYDQLVNIGRQQLERDRALNPYVLSDKPITRRQVELGKYADEDEKRKKEEAAIREDEFRAEREQRLEAAGLGDFSLDNAYVIHETPYPPQYDSDGNLILFPATHHYLGKDKVVPHNRTTIHFAVNHVAKPHPLRTGEDARFAIVVPLRSVLDRNPGSLENLFAVDTYFSPPPGKPLVLPKDTVRVVEYKATKPQGEDVGHGLPLSKREIWALLEELNVKLPEAWADKHTTQEFDGAISRLAEQLGVTSSLHADTHQAFEIIGSTENVVLHRNQEYFYQDPPTPDQAQIAFMSLMSPNARASLGVLGRFSSPIRHWGDGEFEELGGDKSDTGLFSGAETGIPTTREGRVARAREIIERVKTHGSIDDVGQKIRAERTNGRTIGGAPSAPSQIAVELEATARELGEILMADVDQGFREEFGITEENFDAFMAELIPQLTKPSTEEEDVGERLDPAAPSTMGTILPKISVNALRKENLLEPRSVIDKSSLSRISHTVSRNELALLRSHPRLYWQLTRLQILGRQRFDDGEIDLTPIGRRLLSLLTNEPAMNALAADIAEMPAFQKALGYLTNSEQLKVAKRVAQAFVGEGILVDQIPHNLKDDWLSTARLAAHRGTNSDPLSFSSSVLPDSMASIMQLFMDGLMPKSAFFFSPTEDYPYPDKEKNTIIKPMFRTQEEIRSALKAQSDFFAELGEDDQTVDPISFLDEDIDIIGPLMRLGLVTSSLGLDENIKVDELSQEVRDAFDPDSGMDPRLADTIRAQYIRSERKLLARNPEKRLGGEVLLSPTPMIGGSTFEGNGDFRRGMSALIGKHAGNDAIVVDEEDKLEQEKLVEYFAPLVHNAKIIRERDEAKEITQNNQTKIVFDQMVKHGMGDLLGVTSDSPKSFEELSPQVKNTLQHLSGWLKRTLDGGDSGDSALKVQSAPRPAISSDEFTKALIKRLLDAPSHVAKIVDSDGNSIPLRRHLDTMHQRAVVAAFRRLGIEMGPTDEMLQQIFGPGSISFKATTFKGMTLDTADKKLILQDARESITELLGLIPRSLFNGTQIIDGSPMALNLSVIIANGRAHAKNKGRGGAQLQLDPAIVKTKADIKAEDWRSTALHEIGHGLEFTNELLREIEAAAILARLEPDERLEKLSKITANPRYKPRELAYRDKFGQAYAGKIYTYKAYIDAELQEANIQSRDPDRVPVGDAFEIFTTGIESVMFPYMDDRPDRDHTLFTIGALAVMSQFPSKAQPPSTTQQTTPQQIRQIPRGTIDIDSMVYPDSVMVRPDFKNIKQFAQRLADVHNTVWDRDTTVVETPVSGGSQTQIADLGAKIRDLELAAIADLRSRYAKTPDGFIALTRRGIEIVQTDPMGSTDTEQINFNNLTDEELIKILPRDADGLLEIRRPFNYGRNDFDSDEIRTLHTIRTLIQTNQVTNGRIVEIKDAQTNQLVGIGLLDMSKPKIVELRLFASVASNDADYPSKFRATNRNAPASARMIRELFLAARNNRAEARMYFDGPETSFPSVNIPILGTFSVGESPYSYTIFENGRYNDLDAEQWFEERFGRKSKLLKLFKPPAHSDGVGKNPDDWHGGAFVPKFISVSPTVAKLVSDVIESNMPLRDADPNETTASGLSSGASKPRYPRTPPAHAMTGRAEEIFGKARSWREFRQILAENDVIVIDYETTGLVFDEFGKASSNGKPTQIGAVRMRDGKVIDRFNLFVNPGMPMSAWEQWSRDNLVDGEGNKLTDDFFADKPGIAEAHQMLVDFMGPDAILVMQNAVFDDEVLTTALEESGIKWRPGGIIDTKEMSRMTLPRWTPENPDGPSRTDSRTGQTIPSNGLADITKYLGVELGDKHHSADYDAQATGEVLTAIVEGGMRKGWSRDFLSKEKRDESIRSAYEQFDRDVEQFERDKAAWIESSSAPQTPSGREQVGERSQAPGSGPQGLASGNEDMGPKPRWLSILDRETTPSPAYNNFSNLAQWDEQQEILRGGFELLAKGDLESLVGFANEWFEQYLSEWNANRGTDDEFRELTLDDVLRFFQHQRDYALRGWERSGKSSIRLWRGGEVTGRRMLRSFSDSRTEAEQYSDDVHEYEIPLSAIVSVGRNGVPEILVDESQVARVDDGGLSSGRHLGPIGLSSGLVDEDGNIDVQEARRVGRLVQEKRTRTLDAGNSIAVRDLIGVDKDKRDELVDEIQKAAEQARRQMDDKIKILQAKIDELAQKETDSNTGSFRFGIDASSNPRVQQLLFDLRTLVQDGQGADVIFRGAIRDISDYTADSVVIVRNKNNEIIAVATLRSATFTRDRRPTVTILHASTVEQSAGLGSTMFSEIVKVAKDKDASLSLVPLESARDYWESLGFEFIQQDDNPGRRDAVRSAPDRLLAKFRDSVELEIPRAGVIEIDKAMNNPSGLSSGADDKSSIAAKRTRDVLQRVEEIGVDLDKVSRDVEERAKTVNDVSDRELIRIKGAVKLQQLKPETTQVINKLVSENKNDLEILRDAASWEYQKADSLEFRLAVARQIAVARNDGELVSTIDRFITDVGQMTDEEFVSAYRNAERSFAATFDQRPHIYTRTPKQVVDSGRYQTVHDGQQTMGGTNMWDPDTVLGARLITEQALLGFPVRSETGEDDTKPLRPVSSMVVSRHFTSDRRKRMKEMYGDDVVLMHDYAISDVARLHATSGGGIGRPAGNEQAYGFGMIVLRPEVADRTLAVRGDSISDRGSSPIGGRLSRLNDNGVVASRFFSPESVLFASMTGRHDTLASPILQSPKRYNEGLVVGGVERDDIQAIVAYPADLRTSKVGKPSSPGAASNAFLTSLIEAAKTRDEYADKYGIDVVIESRYLPLSDVEPFNPKMTRKWVEQQINKGSMLDVTADELIPSDNTTPYEALLRYVKIRTERDGLVPGSVLFDHEEMPEGDKEKAALLSSIVEKELTRIAPGRPTSTGLSSGDDYRGQHTAPSRDWAAPLHDLGVVYPADIYDAEDPLQMYGTGEDELDKRAIDLIRSMRGKPNAQITIYRAVPLSKQEELDRLVKQREQIMARGRIPRNPEPFYGVSGMNASEYYDRLIEEIERLKAELEKEPENSFAINAGDWVTPFREYALEHGRRMYRSAGKYRIVQKKVRASEIFTAGDSWLEWGYDPEPKAKK